MANRLEFTVHDAFSSLVLNIHGDGLGALDHRTDPGLQLLRGDVQHRDVARVL